MENSSDNRYLLNDYGTNNPGSTFEQNRQHTSQQNQQQEFVNYQMNKHQSPNNSGYRNRTQRSAFSDKQYRTPICYHCNNPGHYKTNCPNLKNGNYGERSSNDMKSVSFKSVGGPNQSTLTSTPYQDPLPMFGTNQEDFKTNTKIVFD
ncbi:hypothetical protein BpHYR1_048519 [Brachionus plicatilis]|uniref:CCHC-type domain-containing protein n=1 Tax=Brachionus plicatilis TaxID=10195 RepID=A0A3M7Q7G7_BRAPC|nr:hypothetical protein BpHYR1_048519 [Brachionus plicatilis]